jgi:hypothetical protein
LAVAELIVISLPQEKEIAFSRRTTVTSYQQVVTASDDESNQLEPAASSYGSGNDDEEAAVTNEDEANKASAIEVHPPQALRLNLIGGAVAIITVGSTVLIFTS